MFIISIQLSASTKYLLARFYTAVLSLANAHIQKRANIYHLIFVDSRGLRLADYLWLADFCGQPSVEISRLFAVS